jgi:hypothetical protein
MMRDLATSTRGRVALPGAALAIVLLLAGLVVQTHQAVAAKDIQTFGPGQVDCQALSGTQVDCLLAASLVIQDNRNVATFSVSALPRGEQGLFRQWCVAVANECTVTVMGRLASPQSTRISVVTSVRWTRLSAPVDQAAARAAGAAPPDTNGTATRAAQ